MSFLGKLATKGWLLSWGMAVDRVCMPCHLKDESREHLFFECEYSLVVWKLTLQNNIARPCLVLSREIVGMNS